MVLSWACACAVDGEHSKSARSNVRVSNLPRLPICRLACAAPLFLEGGWRPLTFDFLAEPSSLNTISYFSHLTWYLYTQDPRDFWQLAAVRAASAKGLACARTGWEEKKHSTRLSLKAFYCCSNGKGVQGSRRGVGSCVWLWLYSFSSICICYGTSVSKLTTFKNLATPRKVSKISPHIGDRRVL